MAERTNEKATVIAMRVDEPIRKQVSPIYAELSAASKRYAQGSAEAGVVSQEADILLKEFLLYPNRYKFLVVTDSHETGKVRLFECFLSYKDRDVVSADGGLIRYGNDFPSSDNDVLSSKTSWAKRRYAHLFAFDHLEPANFQPVK